LNKNQGKATYINLGSENEVYQALTDISVVLKKELPPVLLDMEAYFFSKILDKIKAFQRPKIN
jgi:hypothetical protein